MASGPSGELTPAQQQLQSEVKKFNDERDAAIQKKKPFYGRLVVQKKENANPTIVFKSGALGHGNRWSWFLDKIQAIFWNKGPLSIAAGREVAKIIESTKPKEYASQTNNEKLKINQEITNLFNKAIITTVLEVVPHSGVELANDLEELWEHHSVALVDQVDKPLIEATRKFLRSKYCKDHPKELIRIVAAIKYQARLETVLEVTDVNNILAAWRQKQIPAAEKIIAELLTSSNQTVKEAVAKFAPDKASLFIELLEHDYLEAAQQLVLNQFNVNLTNDELEKLSQSNKVVEFMSFLDATCGKKKYPDTKALVDVIVQYLTGIISTERGKRLGQFQKANLFAELLKDDYLKAIQQFILNQFNVSLTNNELKNLYPLDQILEFISFLDAVCGGKKYPNTRAPVDVVIQHLIGITSTEKNERLKQFRDAIKVLTSLDPDNDPILHIHSVILGLYRNKKSKLIKELIQALPNDLREAVIEKLLFNERTRRLQAWAAKEFPQPDS